MVTPLLNKLRVEGGTLYTFPSAQKDLARILTNDSYSFTFSHFACLDFPDKNKLNRDAFPKQSNEIDYNVMLAEHFQNYIMNFETAILNGEGDDDDYDNTIVRSVSERIFFNWMRKIGAIDFVSYGTESNLFYEGVRVADGSDSDEEEDIITYNYSNSERHSEYVNKRTVKYIGNVDVINSVEVNGDTYSEVYIHIPGSVGASYEVRFVTTTDDNYDGGTYSISGEGETIIGAAGKYTNSLSDNGLSVSAIYDFDSPNDNEYGYKNTYEGDAGYIIDFRDTFYRNDIVGYGDIMTMNELSPDDFEFNCVLIYYDLEDVSTGEKATNLYGVLFLEEAKGDARNGYIQRYPKHKTTDITPGNSFALKIDFKIDAYPTSSMTGAYENKNQELIDYFQLYTEAMTKLQTTLDIFDRQQGEILELQKRVHELETLFFGIDSFNDVSSRVRNLEQRLNSSGLADQEELTNLISEVSNRLQSVVSGKIPTELQYNTDVLKDGYGIHIDKQNGDVILKSSLTSYSLNNIQLCTTSGGSIVIGEDEVTSDNPLNIYHQDANEKNIVYTQLEEGTNLVMLYVKGDVCSNNVYLYIDDSGNKWRVGQTLKLKIKDFIDFDSFSLFIYTGNEDGLYKQKIEISGEDLPYSPTIEMICTNETMNTYNSSFIYEISSTENVYGEGTGSGSGSSSTTMEAIPDNQIDDLINEL